jgi:putative PIN family toxin of toxin-antitoxin system
MKVILDTNVLLSSLLFSGFAAKVHDFCVIHFNVISSDWLFDELEEKLLGKFTLSEEQAERFIVLLQERTSVVHPFNELPDVCRDVDDNHVLQLADYIQADCIITGDKDLLVLESFKKTQIFSPREFYDKFIDRKF